MVNLEAFKFQILKLPQITIMIFLTESFQNFRNVKLTLALIAPFLASGRFRCWTLKMTTENRALTLEAACLGQWWSAMSFCQAALFQPTFLALDFENYPRIH